MLGIIVDIVEGSLENIGIFFELLIAYIKLLVCNLVRQIIVKEVWEAEDILTEKLMQGTHSTRSLEDPIYMVR